MSRAHYSLQERMKSLRSQDSHSFTLTENRRALYRSLMFLNLMLPFCGHAMAET